jgi:glycosyltransferase involved in cell wall biosynthesis
MRQDMSQTPEPRAKRLVVIVPAFNEQDVVRQTLEEIRQHMPDADVLVVDDSSTDRTGAEAALGGAEVARLPFHMGVGGAIRLGYRYAVEQDYDYAIRVDADGQHDAAFMGSLIEQLDYGYDVVVGARFAGEGDYQMGRLRRLTSRMLSALLSRLCGTTLTDPTSGFQATSRRACETFARDYPVEYLGDTVEALALAAHHGLRIIQVPVVMRQRSTGAPSQSPAKSSVLLARALSLALLRR